MTPSLYDRIGAGYANYRRADNRIARLIDAALAQSRNVLNVGAGAGSYEPSTRLVIAAEPSREMIRQRSRNAAPCVQATADRLPFKNCSFDAALAILTIHHWPDPEKGLVEMRRVARDRVVIFTWDPEHSGFWLTKDYVPEILEIDRPIFPSLSDIEKAIGPVQVQTISIPADCSDGFLGAYWRRPECYLDAGVRAAISGFSKFDPSKGIAKLASDIENQTWKRRYGDLLSLSELDVGYRLVVARRA